MAGGQRHAGSSVTAWLLVQTMGMCPVVEYKFFDLSRTLTTYVLSPFIHTLIPENIDQKARTIPPGNWS